MAFQVIRVETLFVILAVITRNCIAQSICVDVTIEFQTNSDRSSNVLSITGHCPAKDCEYRHGSNQQTTMLHGQCIHTGPFQRNLRGHHGHEHYLAEQKSEITIESTGDYDGTNKCKNTTFKLPPNIWQYNIHCDARSKCICKSTTQYPPGVKKCIPFCVRYSGHQKNLVVTGSKMSQTCEDFLISAYELMPTYSRVCFFAQENSQILIVRRTQTSRVSIYYARNINGLHEISCKETETDYECINASDVNDGIGLKWHTQLPVSPETHDSVKCVEVQVEFQVNYGSSNILNINADHASGGCLDHPGSYEANLTGISAFERFTAKEESKVTVESNGDPNLANKCNKQTFNLAPNAWKVTIKCNAKDKCQCYSGTIYAYGHKKCIPICVRYIGYQETVNIKGIKSNNEKCSDFETRYYNLEPKNSQMCFFAEEGSVIKIRRMYRSVSFTAQAENGFMDVTCIGTSIFLNCQKAAEIGEKIGITWHPGMSTQPTMYNYIPCLTIYLTFDVWNTIEGNPYFEVEFNNLDDQCSTQNVTENVITTHYAVQGGQIWFATPPGSFFKIRFRNEGLTYMLNNSPLGVFNVPSIDLDCGLIYTYDSLDVVGYRCSATESQCDCSLSQGPTPFLNDYNGFAKSQ